MKLDEAAAQLLLAAEVGSVARGEIVEWADRWILTLDSPPTWLIDLSTSGSGRLEDVYSLLRHASDPKFRDTEHQIITVIDAHAQDRLRLDDALMRLWRIWDSAHATQDFPEDFADLLVEWDCLDNPTEIPPGLGTRCVSLFGAYRAARSFVGSHYRKPEIEQGQQAEDGDTLQRPC